MEALIQPGMRMRYLLAGRSIVTIVGKRSRFTFKIKSAPKAPGKLWVSVLSGAENADDKSYRFLGTIINDSTEYKPFFRHSPKSPVGIDAPSVQAFVWAFKNAEDPRVLFYHSGKCGRCGRRLTTPESITTGLGPVCAGREASGREASGREGEEEPAPRRPDALDRSLRRQMILPSVRAAASALSSHSISIAGKHHGEFA
jgi:hypothetical protein